MANDSKVPAVESAARNPTGQAGSSDERLNPIYVVRELDRSHVSNELRDLKGKSDQLQSELGSVKSSVGKLSETDLSHKIQITSRMTACEFQIATLDKRVDRAVILLRKLSYVVLTLAILIILLIVAEMH